MADRFPLAVNYSSRKIEEFVSGDNLDLTGNGIIVNGDVGVSGQYLKSNGSTLEWDNPGDVYLTASQTLTNKTLESSTISGSVNTLSNIPNSALVNSGITVNGSTVSLGGSVTTPNDNTTYSVSAVDGLTAAQKIIRLTSSTSVTDDVILSAGSPSSVPSGSNALSLFLDRSDDNITISGYVVDNNTVTTIQAFSGGTAQSGAITFRGTGGASVTQDAGTRTITISSLNDDTITRLRAGTGQAYADGDFTFLGGTAVTLAQGVDGNNDPTITINSSDTITRLKGGGAGSLVTGDVEITGGSNVTVSQSGQTITIASTDTNTVTQVASGGEALAAGNFRFIASGASSISQSSAAGVTTIEISSVNTDTGAEFSAGTGLTLSGGTEFSVTNADNLIDNRISKWDNANSQFANSIITDNGSTVTINGDLNVTGTNTILETSTLIVEDNTIELRRGNSLTGSNGGIQVNRTTNSSGAVTSFNTLEWFEAGAYWRSYDGSVAKRFVTETDTQVLTGKTLTSPILTTPTLGVATATTLNGLSIATTANSTLDIADLKTITLNNSLTLNGTDGTTINFGNGGGPGAVVAYSSYTLGNFATTTSVQLRGVVSDSTGTGVLVFSSNPVFSTSIRTSSSSIDVFNTSATGINFAGAGTQISIGSSSGTTTINHGLNVANNVELGTTVSNTLLINGVANFENADIQIRGTDTTPMFIGRGGGAVSSNTRVGYAALGANQSGSQNTAMGNSALIDNISGAACSAYGFRALSGQTTGSNNNAFGKDSQLRNDTGIGNVSFGNSSLENNTDSDYNVCIGHFAGYNLTGSGNVIIGAASTEDSTSTTYQPPAPNGDNQLVIGSGTGVWVRGDSTYGVTIPNNFRVNGSTIIDGDLTVSGSTVTVNSNTISIDDKNIELAAVVNTTFTANVTNGSATITDISPVSGLIPGMTILSPGGAVPADTYIVTLNAATRTATLSNAVSASTGGETFIGQGPTDLGASGGGLIIKGTPVLQGGTGDKTILYDHSRTDKYFVSSESFELANGKQFAIGNQLVLSGTTLGDGVINSSLTSVGVLVGPAGSPALEVDGAVVLGGRVVEKTFGNFTTNLTVATNTLNVTPAGANTILGTTPTSAINTWAFNTADPDGNTLENGQTMTVTLIIDANTAATYGDACTVDGNAVATGVQWSGGSPPVATTNTDILTFIIVKDSAGVVKVFGQGNTDFS